MAEARYQGRTDLVNAFRRNPSSEPKGRPSRPAETPLKLLLTSNIDGTTTSRITTCSESRYRAEGVSTCQLDVCTAAEPVCDGTLLSVCKSDDSGPEPDGTECASGLPNADDDAALSGASRLWRSCANQRALPGGASRP